MSADDLLYAPMNTSFSMPVSAASSTGNDLRLPETWECVMTHLRDWDPNWAETALAGGALRDLDLGRPVKDVDIFMPYGNVTKKRLTECLQSLYSEPLWVSEVTHDPKSNSSLSNGMICPSHFTFYMDGWKFEITQKIEPFTQRSILDSFDLGICMIAYEHQMVYRSPEYLKDVADKTITIVRSTGGREIPHAERLQRKYVGWSIVQP